MKDKLLEVDCLSCGYEGVAVVDDVTFDVGPGESLVLLGPNGVGKTTLFKTILGFIPAIAGTVRFEGEDARGWNRRRFAQTVAYLPQDHLPAFSFRVRDLVLMGRTPLLEGAVPGRHDEQVVDEVLNGLGIEELAERAYTSLSGGERQMVLIARALAQQPRLIVMDEPCSSLDYGNQVRLLEQIVRLNEAGLSVVMTTHDPNHAFLLDSKVFCMGRAGAFRYGRAVAVLGSESLTALYGVDVGITNAVSPSGEVVESCVPFLREGLR